MKLLFCHHISGVGFFSCTL